jgi:hypothetical protein
VKNIFAAGFIQRPRGNSILSLGRGNFTGFRGRDYFFHLSFDGRFDTSILGAANHVLAKSFFGTIGIWHFLSTKLQNRDMFTAQTGRFRTQQYPTFGPFCLGFRQKYQYMLDSGQPAEMEPPSNQDRLPRILFLING